MALDTATSRRFFREYWDWDSRTANARDHFELLMIHACFARGKEYQNIFSLVITGLVQLILESLEMFIGRVLYTGFAISDCYMLIIPDSLMEWLHLSKCPLYPHLTYLHWSPIGVGGIGYDQICQSFGRQIFFRAARFNLAVQFRILRIDNDPPAEEPSPPTALISAKESLKSHCKKLIILLTLLRSMTC
jgi:hypothetical protein